MPTQVPRAGAILMERVIKRKFYSTNGSLVIHGWDNGFNVGDYRYCSATLYKTVNGKYYIVGEGGGGSKYAVENGNGMCGGSEMILVTEEEALTWLEEHRGEQVLIKDFKDFIEQG